MSAILCLSMLFFARNLIPKYLISFRIKNQLCNVTSSQKMQGLWTLKKQTKV